MLDAEPREIAEAVRGEEFTAAELVEGTGAVELVRVDDLAGVVQRGCRLGTRRSWR